MKPQDLANARNKDLAASLTAIRRAAAMARTQAIQTGTAIVVNRNQKLVRITADELRQEGAC